MEESEFDEAEGNLSDLVSELQMMAEIIITITIITIIILVSE